MKISLLKLIVDNYILEGRIQIIDRFNGRRMKICEVKPEYSEDGDKLVLEVNSDDFYEV